MSDQTSEKNSTNSIMVMIGGKKVTEVEFPVWFDLVNPINRTHIEKRALLNPKIQKYFGGKSPSRIIYIPSCAISFTP